MIVLGIPLTIIMKFIVTLFAIINPFSCAGIYLDTVKNASDKDKFKIATYMIIAVFIALVAMVWVGSDILDIFGINQDAFRAGGGLIVLFFGLRIVGVISSKNSANISQQTPQDLAIVPLAIPLVAGPGTLATVISESHKYFISVEQKLVATACILFLSIGLWAFFSSLPKISHLLGHVLLDVISKIMGLILVAIAVEMIFDGIKSFMFG